MNYNKKLAVAVSGAVLLMAGQFALADSATDIVDALVSKGVLTEEEGKLITKGHKSKTDITPVVKTKDNALSLETADGNSSIQVNGRIHFDYRNYDYEDNTNATAALATGSDTFDLRRARIGVKGKFGKYYSGEVVINVLDESKMALDVGYVDVAWFEKAKFRLGQFKMPFSLEQLTSSNNVDFIERSFVDGQIPLKERGVQVFGSPKTGTTYAVALSTGNAAADNTAVLAREGDNGQDGLDIIGRGTVNLAEIVGNPKEDIFHLGLAFSGGNRLANQSVNNIGADGTTRTRSMTFFDLTAPSFSSSYDSASTVRRLGLEGIVARGPIKIQGQLVRSGYSFASSASATHDPDLIVGYLQATYTLTGETHAGRYKDGVLSGLKPSKVFDPDTFSGGAWEVAFRMGHFDASEYRGFGASILNANSALKAKDYTLGIMFVPSPNVRFMGNFVHTTFSDLTGTGPALGGRNIANENALLFRTQLAF